MHMHAMEAHAQGPPPVGLCPERIDGFSREEPGRPWPDTFLGGFKKPPCAKPIWSPMTDEELMARTFDVMQRRNVYGVTSGPRTDLWKQATPDRIIPSLDFRSAARTCPHPTRFATR